MGIKTQVLCLVVFLTMSFGLYYLVFGNLNILDQQAYFLTNGLVLLILGFFLIERHFTKQRDVVVNSLAVLISLLAVRTPTAAPLQWGLLSYAALMLILSMTSILVMKSKEEQGAGKSKGLIGLQRLVTGLGNARIMFSIVFFYGVIEFYRTAVTDWRLLPFLAFWAVIIVWEPVGIGEKIESLLNLIRSKPPESPIGTIVRSKSPNVIFCELRDDVNLKRNDLVQIELRGDASKDLYGLVLNIFFLDDKNWANVRLLTDLLSRNAGSLYSKSGSVYKVSAGSLSDDVFKLVSSSPLYENRERIAGLVDTDSTVNRLQIQITDPRQEIGVGRVVYLILGNKRIYYQICGGVTREDGLQDANKFGFTSAAANQLGIWNETTQAFDRYDWIPELNTALFLYSEGVEKGILKSVPNRTIVGYVPHTDFPVHVDLDRMVPHHYSVLGITGCGKTTFEIDMIGSKLAAGLKVLCFDITGDYAAIFEAKGMKYEHFYTKEVFDTLEPKIMTLEVEYSKFKNARDQKVITTNETAVKREIQVCVNRMLAGPGQLFLVEIEELANVTNVHDLFARTLREIFEYKKAESDPTPLSIVFEEAHTIIPEHSSSSTDSREADRIVNKISQITLQGRKYGIGFAVITQRTANVAKTILNQCNTVFSFACFDRTGIEFLANYFGDDYSKILPNLGRFQLLAAGRALNSMLPIIVQLPTKDETEVIDVVEARRKLREKLIAPKPTLVGAELVESPDDDLPF